MDRETASIAELSHPSHTCLVYETPEDQVAVTTEFLARGLVRGERCVFLESPERVKAVRQALREAGVDTDAEERRGALVLTSDRGFLDNGHFKEARMITFLEAALQDAQANGFTALRATGDLNWELGDEQDFQGLIDYEITLDQYVRHRPIVGLCQYRRRTIPAAPIRNALETHKQVVLGRLLCTNNLYYQPPDVRTDDPNRAQEKKVDWMCRRLSETMKVQRQRDNALRTLLERQHT